MDNIEAFENTHLNVFDIQAEYKARQRHPAPEAGRKARHRLESGELMLNPNPLLFYQELQRRIEVFENLKVTYLEQETKEKFLRSLLSDPPQLVEQQDLERIRGENKDRKGELKQNKLKMADLESQLTEGSKELCMEYELLTEKAKEARQMAQEMEEMQREIDELAKQQETLELPKQDDPDMNLPVDELKRLTREYTAQKREIDTELDQIQAAAPQTESEKQQLIQDVDRLTEEKEQVEKTANQLVRERQNNPQPHNESTAKWYRAMASLLSSVGGEQGQQQQEHEQERQEQEQK